MGSENQGLRHDRGTCAASAGSATLPGADQVQDALDFSVLIDIHLASDRVKAFAKLFLFRALAIVPGTSLKPHDKNVVPDEMRRRSRAQQPTIGIVRTKIADLSGRGQSGARERRL